MLFLFQENAWRIRMLPLHLSQKWFINHAQFSLPLCRTLFWALYLVFWHYWLCLWLCIISTGGTGDGGECSSTSGQYSIFSEVCVCTLQKKTQLCLCWKIKLIHLIRVIPLENEINAVFVQKWKSIFNVSQRSAVLYIIIQYKPLFSVLPTQIHLSDYRIIWRNETHNTIEWESPS